MVNKFIISVIAATCLLANPTKTNKEEIKNNSAERGAFFYEFEDINTTATPKSNSNEAATSTGKPGDSKAIKLLEELLKVAREQRDIQSKILEIISEEANPTPKTIVVNGKECIQNSSADCFVMPVTNDAKKIPVIKELITNPTPETAKNYLQWQAKYLSTGPFKVGRSFQYAMNTWGEEAYPMNITRSSVNTNTDELSAKRENLRQQILNDLYSNSKLGLYIFLQADSLDYFALEHISEIVKNIDNKKAVTIVFKNNGDKQNILNGLKGIMLKNSFLSAKMVVNEKLFSANNIYMTPTYMVAVNHDKISKKQSVAIGRLDFSELNIKIYEWLEQESIVKRGGLSDYKAWQADNQNNGAVHEK